MTKVTNHLDLVVVIVVTLSKTTFSEINAELLNVKRRVRNTNTVIVHRRCPEIK